MDLTSVDLSGPNSALFIMVAGFGLFWRYVNSENRIKRQDYAKQREEDSTERKLQIQAYENGLKELRMTFEAALARTTSAFETTIAKINEREEARERLSEERFKLVLLDRLNKKDAKT